MERGAEHHPDTESAIGTVPLPSERGLTMAAASRNIYAVETGNWRSFDPPTIGTRRERRPKRRLNSDSDGGAQNVDLLRSPFHPHEQEHVSQVAQTSSWVRNPIA